LWYSLSQMSDICMLDSLWGQLCLPTNLTDAEE
jgi:hypothetical protein